jgi:tRNA-Thr(GGU) m(6)t(6)A37 methyltransferase TsaA
MAMKQIDIRAIGKVVSPLVNLADAPRQPDEHAPAAWLVFEPAVVDGLRDLKAGDVIIVVTWLDRARRDVLTVHPRGDLSRSPEGVFSTRSPDRPNPIGLHEVTIESIENDRLRVRNLEAIDGTPILDIKPVLNVDVERR